jgi:hypothetical protein
MTKNPFINAITASLYIALIVTVMTLGTKFTSGPDNYVMPVAMLSLFTLSAGVMGYLFLSQPIQLFLDGKKKQAVSLFLQTLGVFAGITLVAVVLSFSRVL